MSRLSNIIGSHNELMWSD